MSVMWNPWHGCRRVSEGCRNCYVFRMDASHGMSAEKPRINSDFLLPLRENRNGTFKIRSGETVYTCFSSDFLLEDADEWRTDAWKMMKMRSDLHFVFFTKRIERLSAVLPSDWENGYENVTVGCTCENQMQADARLPVFLSLPLRHRMIVCEPLLEDLHLLRYLDRQKIESVCAGGESGPEARVCDFSWILTLRQDCLESGVRFSYHQTGALLRRDGKLYRIPRYLQHEQAKRAGLDIL